MNTVGLDDPGVEKTGKANQASRYLHGNNSHWSHTWSCKFLILKILPLVCHILVYA